MARPARRSRLGVLPVALALVVAACTGTATTGTDATAPADTRCPVGPDVVERELGVEVGPVDVATLDATDVEDSQDDFAHVTCSFDAEEGQRAGEGQRAQEGQDQGDDGNDGQDGPGPAHGDPVVASYAYYVRPRAADAEVGDCHAGDGPDAGDPAEVEVDGLEDLRHAVRDVGREGDEYTRAAILAGCLANAPDRSVAVRMVVGGDAEVASDEQLAGLLGAVVDALPDDR